MTKRKIDYWVIPPETDGEFVASMEEVLETYAQPYDAKHPVVCMDEQPIQLLNETRVPIPATRKHPRRVDYEYERAGTASIFMFCEPLSGWRQVTVRERRTKIDWAREVEELLKTRYASAEKVILVCDNLNTHTKGAFYEAFEPEGEANRPQAGVPPYAQARQLAEHRRERAQLDDAAVREGPTIRNDREIAIRNGGMAPAQQRQATWRGLAIQSR